MLMCSSWIVYASLGWGVLAPESGASPWSADALVPEGYALAYETEFASGDLGPWVARPGSEWTVRTEGERHILGLTKQGEPFTFRAPFGYVTLPAPEVGDFALVAVVRCLTDPAVKGRDVCAFLGFGDNAHYRYVHLSAEAVGPHNAIAMVDGSDRQPLTLLEPGTPKMLDRAWHLVKVTREMATGTIRAYVDDMASPCLMAVDPKPEAGRVGLGSFDDPMEIGRVWLYTPEEARTVPDFRTIVPEGSAIRKVATGFQFTEGPSWDWAHGRLLFSDIPASRIYALTPDGGTSTYMDPSLQSNGTTFDRDGFLLACRHEARDVVRVGPDGKVAKVLAHRYAGKLLNSPNDLVMTPDGVIYFTDPRFGSMDGLEQDCQAVYRIDTDGALTRVISDMPKPNGLAVSPDGTTLYVADSNELHVRAYPLLPDGSCGEGRTLCRLQAPEPGVPDGMRLDERGNIYCTGSGGVWVFTPEGEKLGRIDTPEVPANCCFGGPEGKRLWITAQTSIYAIDLAVRGQFPVR